MRNITPDNTRLLVLQRTALQELFDTLDIDGVIISLDGAGYTAYRSLGYESTRAYTTPEDIQKLLSGILPVFEQYQKQCILRAPLSSDM